VNQKQLIRLFAVAILIQFTLSGCGWLRGLRKEADEETYASRNSIRDEVEYYKDPANRNLPPPPISAADARSSIVSGSAVDLSGVRAKNLRVTAKDFMAENHKNENSLWSEEGQNNYLFARNKLKMPGDIVTVMIEDGLRKDMIGAVKRTLPPEYQDQEIRVPGLTKDLPGTATPPATGASGETPAATPATTTHDDMLTAEVLERYPNGNVRLRGVKRIPFRTQIRNIEVVAIVKGAEIGENDIVSSSKFFEQRVEMYR
jgi:flagellar basal body L-ring protein FlgH